MWLANSGKLEIGSWDVKGKKAGLLGDGNDPVAFTAMVEYVFPILI